MLFAIISNFLVKAIFYDSSKKDYFLNRNFYNYLVQGPASYAVRQNLALFILLLGSLYFVLCALISISYNGNQLSSSFQKGSVGEKKDSLKLTICPVENAKFVNAPTLTKDSLENFEMAKLDSPSNSEKFNVLYHEKLVGVQKDFNTYMSFIKAKIEEYNQALNEFNTFQARKAKDIELKVNATDLNNRLFSVYSNSISSTFGQEVEFELLQFENYKNNIIYYIESVYFLNQNARVHLANYFSYLKGLDSNSQDINGFFPLSNINSIFPPSNNLYAFRNSFKEFKEPPKRGSEWGVLGRITGWLTDAQSIDLILIIGMFGFEFLGAVISSFVNACENLKINKPIVDNLSVVIISGFSAAIVIFLATKGGIAVVNSGTNEPNPYVLFFTCPIGSVYSERIWDWARTQISSRYNPNLPPPPPGGPGAVPPGAVPPVPPVPQGAAVILPQNPPPPLPGNA